MNSMSLVVVFNEPEVKHFLRSSFFFGCSEIDPVHPRAPPEVPRGPWALAGTLGGFWGFGKGGQI